MLLDDDQQQTLESVRDIFNRTLTYFTFHFTLNYGVLGWLAGKHPSLKAIISLAVIFVFHNACALVTFRPVLGYLRVQAVLPLLLPPYRLATKMMLVTLVAMIVAWIAAPFLIA